MSLQPHERQERDEVRRENEAADAPVAKTFLVTIRGEGEVDINAWDIRDALIVDEYETDVEQITVNARTPMDGGQMMFFSVEDVA